MGKSAAATALAEALKWPLMRSERAQVGSHSLSGLVQDALGFSSDYIQRVADGTAGIVVDSLDEAHFKAGTENLLAFIENVQKVSGSGVTSGRATRQPSVVIFSRSDTAKWVRLTFDAQSVPLATARVNFFDQQSAHSFIESYLDIRFSETNRTDYHVARANPSPYEKLRDKRMRSIASVLLGRAEVNLGEDWADVQDFLGYAPVLVALAESLAVKNPSAEIARLDAANQNDLLEAIVDHILTREQGKLADQCGPKLRALQPADDGGVVDELALYAPLEQCIRLVAATTGVELASVLPVALPDAVRPVYEESVGLFLPDHPFMKGREFASVVFRDYVFARICTDLLARAALPVTPEAVVDDVGPFFARFLAKRIESESDGAVREEILEQVIHSWNQEVMLARSTESAITVALNDEIGHVDCWRAGVNGTDVRELSFEVTGLSGAFHLSRPVRDAVIVTENGLIVGRSGQHVRLGPGVVLAAEELAIEAESLRIEVDRDGGVGCTLAATSLVANRLQRIESGPDSLRVLAPDPPPVLRSYRRELRTKEEGFVPFQHFLDLRTILTAFRPSTSTPGRLAVLSAKLDKKIVGSSGSRKVILSALEAAGVVSNTGRWWYLDLNALGRLGFGLTDFQRGEPSPPLLAFLAGTGA